MDQNSTSLHVGVASIRSASSEMNGHLPKQLGNVTRVLSKLAVWRAYRVGVTVTSCRSLDYYIAKIEENIPEKEATTYLANKTTCKEPSWAIKRPKSMKKTGQIHTYLVRVFAAQMGR